jgi:hypothetical protein
MLEEALEKRACKIKEEVDIYHCIMPIYICVSSIKKVVLCRESKH